MINNHTFEDHTEMYTNRTSSEPSGDSCEGIERLELETQQLEHGTEVMFMSHCPSILPPPPSTLPAEFTIKPDAVRQKKFNYANPPLSVISFPTTNASKIPKLQQVHHPLLLLTSLLQ